MREGSTIVLDNGVGRAGVDERGLVTSLLDGATGRDVIRAGQAAGLFQVHRDNPARWDAWDIDEQYRRHALDLIDAQQVDIVGGGVTVTLIR